MPVGGELLCDGEYNIVYNAIAVGLFEGDDGVPALGYSAKGERVNKTSRYAGTTIDVVDQGRDWDLTFRCLEWRPGVLSAFYPFSVTLGLLGVIGRLYYGMAVPVVMTSITGTPAATMTPLVTLTANKAIVPPEYANQKINFGPTLRKTPIQLMLLPFGVDSISTVGAFSFT
jgi:hypothetical protein